MTTKNLVAKEEEYVIGNEFGSVLLTLSTLKQQITALQNTVRGL
jgi:hypothetical protein